MRGREFRRYKAKQVVINRLKFICNNSHYYIFSDANGNVMTSYRWIDFIGTYDHFLSKTLTTKSSKYKNKWGKRRKAYWDSDGKNRVADKKKFKKMLENDYGIKHLNISYGFIQNITGEQELDII